MMNWYGTGMSGWGYTLMAINMVLFWGLVIVGIVLLVRSLSGGARSASHAPAEQSAPQRILAERFAHGDIDEDEYRRRLDILAAGPKP